MNNKLRSAMEIDINYFRQLDIRAVKVVSAEKVEKSRSLLRLIVDLGGEQKQIISSIADYYNPSDLIGKTIIILNNLKPAKFMGLESQGMLLAVDNEEGVKLLTVDGEVKPGSRVS
ncbi:methionine--tRNA ligase subunit beta [Thermoplasma sp.]|uniref:methionine--tRNA ligase subunit beta n=1 Tax=Thermoplasma sp. TaxID=1973142 RepID=UPI001286717A|nr:methionine--tRNA ligase subunit beta [Thermoplasma sp.]KAA8922050.1 MAG: methionine--tRNA ligase subunit beta [Thermoplasma sp.]